MGTHPIFESDFDCLTEMIDEIEAEAHSFLHGNDEIAAGQVSQLLRDLYHDAQIELFLDGMDDEQIYQQIELGLTTSILSRKDDFELFEPEDFDQSEDDESKADIQADNLNESEVDENEEQIEEEENEEDEDEFGEPDSKKSKFDMGSDLDDEELETEAKKTYKKTQLDDQFFSLREMEEVCQKQEEKEVDEAILDEDIMDELYGDGMDGDDDEDDGGLFGENEDDREMEDSKGIMANDFFAPSTFEKRAKEYAPSWRNWRLSKSRTNRGI